ncbi:MAG: right-handed parallel beta-helix repeat-containing protein [Leptospiraceae bacterium]|nr:right-handed parallel beta-helix repeat-containing protein [Leptospiraceae bacterium]
MNLTEIRLIKRRTHYSIWLCGFSLLIFVLDFFLACKGYNSQEYLDADFIAEDLTPIDLLAPTHNSTTSKTPIFTWSRRSGVKRYVFELSKSSDFAEIILRKNLLNNAYELNNDDLIGISALDAQSYHWRVVAQYKHQSINSNSAIMHTIETNIVYVNANMTGNQLGNKSFPYKTIQSGIEAANSLRNGSPTITCQVFVAQGIYTETIQLRPGISLRGGYEANNWTRDIYANLTSIIAASDAAVRGGADITTAFTATTVVDGFTITGGNFSSNAAISNYYASPTFSNNVINGGAGNFSHGISSNYASSPVISYNTISGGNGANSSRGVYESGSASVISNNIIFGGNGISNSTGITITNTASPTVKNNLIVGGNNSTNNYGISTGGGGGGTIVNNTILGGSGSGNNYGIGMAGVVLPTVISNNTINGGSAGTAYGIRMFSGATPEIRNNIIFTSVGTGTCIYESAAGDDPVAMENNNLFGCTTALYRDHDTGADVTNLSTSITLPTGTLASMGNINVDNTGNQLFVNMVGADNDINTMTDNDWHLTANAAICDVRGGGRDLSTSFTSDKDGLTRTISAITGCTPSNTGASNWSMGAFESN